MAATRRAQAIRRASAWCVGLIAALSAPALLLGQSDPHLESRVRSELLNKTFVAKIDLGNALKASTTAVLLVDTSIDLAGNITLNTRITGYRGSEDVGPACAPNGRPGQLACRLVHGTRVAVVKLDFIDDRLEVWLRSVGNPGGAYAKIKILAGKDWQLTMTAESVLDCVAKALIIESVERAHALAREYSQFRDRLERLSGTEPSDVEKRLENASAIRDALEALIKNRTAADALSGASSSAEINRYQARLAETNQDISQLQQAAQKAHAARLRDAVATQMRTGEGLRSQLLSRDPRSLAEWATQIALLNRWQDTLDQCARLREELGGLGETTAASDAAAWTAERQDIGRRRSALEALKGKLELADLNAVYVRLKADEARLKGAYVSAFETPRQHDAAEQFRTHVQSMIGNRQDASNHGDQGATAELQRLRAELAAIK